jgi:hypothetical protein
MKRSNEAPKLAPCPFCGSRTAPKAGRTRVWWVTCEEDDVFEPGCGAQGPQRDPYSHARSFKTRIAASAAWNRQARAR